MRPDRLLPLIVATALFIENLDASAVATALPAIARDLGTSAVALKLALTSYLLAVAVVLPVSGWIADRYGARRTFTAAMAVFLLGSLGCAAAVSLETLVAARFVQGIGGALMVPVGRIVLLRQIPKQDLVDAMAWLTMPALLAPILGPPLGGLIVTVADWRGIFLLNLPIGALGLWLAQRHIPDQGGPSTALDARGFALCGGGLALAISGLSLFGRVGLAWWVPALLLLVGAALLAGYAAHARRHPAPLIDLSLLQLPTFRAGVLGGALFRIGVGATPFLLPLLLQLGFGMTPLASGLLTLATAVGALLMKPFAPHLLRRFGFRRVLVANALLASLLMGLHAVFSHQTPTVVILLLLALTGAARSLQFTSLGVISYDEVDAARMGQASSLAGMVQQLSLCLGIALGAYALQFAARLSGTGETDAGNFGLAFIAVAALSATSVLLLRRLSPHAGAELARRSAAPRSA